MSIRVRYAPSPTGAPHIGNIRTALYNYLLAQKMDGTFILRIEDSDQNRLVQGSDSVIIATLKALGMDFDEGPTYQSHFLQRYNDAAKELISRSRAYYCFCAPERLENVRKEQEGRGEPTRYDGTCKSIPPHEAEKRSDNEPHVIRFAVEKGKSVTFKDLIHGDIEFNSDTVDDFVIIKSDGYPTYHLAATYDDHLMKISHVIRGDEWISSTPKHLMLYSAFGFEPPLFAHLPVILGTDKTKLSKRHGAMSAMEYINQGYLPDALLNFIALLGWNPGTDQEIFSKQELIMAFSLERVHSSPAVFDQHKLDWVNQQHIKKLSDDALITHIKEYHATAGIENGKITNWQALIPPIRERIKKFSDFNSDEWLFMSDMFGAKKDTPSYEKTLLIPAQSDKETTEKALTLCNSVWGSVGEGEWDAHTLEKKLLNHGSDLSKQELLWPVRVAISGQKNSPPIWDMAASLGRGESLRRIEGARALLLY